MQNHCRARLCVGLKHLLGCLGLILEGSGGVPTLLIQLCDHVLPKEAAGDGSSPQMPATHVGD